jgi:DHA1 family bicyclomycin/chloramphenicol resistance-like MFS transporter
MTRVTTRSFAISLASIALIGPLAVHAFLPVIPAIKADLALPDGIAQLTFSIALFAMAFSTLAYGTLSDRYGRRPVLLSGLFLFAAGSLTCLFTVSVTWLLLGRILQAMGAGCGMTLVRAIARDAYGPDELVKVLAYLTMFYTIGPMAAPVIAGVLVDQFGWRSVFAFSFTGGALIAAAAFVFVPETRPRAVRGSSAGPGILKSYALLFSRLQFLAFVCQTGFSTAMFLVTAAAASFIMSDLLHRPAAEYGVWFLLFPVGFFAGNLVSGRLGGRALTETMVLSGSLLSFLAGAVMCALLAAGVITPMAIFIPGFFITFAQGLALPYAQAGAMAVEPGLAGTASGIGVFMQNFLGASSTQAFGLLSDGTVWPLIFTCSAASLIMLGFGIVPWWLRHMK